MKDRDRGRPGLLERPVMRESFRTELRSRLMSEAAVVLAPRPRMSWLTQAWLRPAFAAAAAILLVLVGATTAAASSLPGDPLYGLKRTTEDVQVALTFDDLARTQLLSQLADRRLDELATIAAQHPSDAPTATAEYADAVQKFDDALDELRNTESDDKRAVAQALADAAREKHRAVLDSVLEKLSGDGRDDLDQVIQREDQRETAAPTDAPAGGDQRSGDGSGKATTRPATPRPTARPTQRPTATPTETPRSTDKEHD